MKRSPSPLHDDGFTERSAAGPLAGVHVADTGMMEMLIDERA